MILWKGYYNNKTVILPPSTNPKLYFAMATIHSSTSLTNLEKVCSLLGIGVASLLVTSDVQANTLPVNAPNSLISQSTKYTKTKVSSKDIREIQSVVNKAIRTGNINSALRGADLSRTQIDALKKLSKSDLKAISRMQSKLAPINKGELEGAWVGIGII